MNWRGKNHYGTLACGPDYDEGRPDAASGILVRAIRPRDARPLAREEGHRRVRTRGRISERVEDRQLLHATEQMAADGTGGDPPRPRTRPRPRLRSRSARAVPAEERLRRRRGGRIADPGGARSDPRPGERVSGQCATVAAGAGDLQLRPHAGQQPRPCGRRASLSAVPPRASRYHPKGRAPDRKPSDSRHLVGGPPALREVERAPPSAARTPHAPGPVQRPRRRLVRSPPHPY